MNHLPTSLGHGIGFKPHEELTEITETNETELQENSSFYVNLYFKNMKYLKSPDKSYDFSIGETVIVLPLPEILTFKSSREYKDISYTLDDSDDDEDEEEEKKKNGDIDMIQ